MMSLKDRFWPPARSLSIPLGSLVGVMAAIAFFPVLLAIALPVQAAGPTGHLNDTGQTRCLNAAGTALEACSTANSGDTSPYPRQDGRFGRDPAAGNQARNGFSKPAGSGGSGGFAFTPLDVNGNPIPLTGNPPVPSATPRCVWDRVTNLIWEVKTTSGLQNKFHTYGWGSNNTGFCSGGSGCSSNAYIADVNALNLCGETANNWRLPALTELLSIVDHDHAFPAIDSGYFPNSLSREYWSATVYAVGSISAWFVAFDNSSLKSGYLTERNCVRLVRNGQ